jgi:hypothetical protein
MNNMEEDFNFEENEEIYEELELHKKNDGPVKRPLTTERDELGPDGLPKLKPGQSRVGKGVLSSQDLEFLIVNKDNMSVKDLAKALNRSVPFIQKHIEGLPVIKRQRENSIWISKLEASSFWNETKKGLLGLEVTYFKEAWASYLDQFGVAADILATDELMIKDLILLDVFSNRAIIDKSNTIRKLNALEAEIKEASSVPFAERDMDLISSLRSQYSSLISAKISLGKEHLDYQTRKDVKLKDLKGSREQRFKQIEESKRNLVELIRELDTHKRREEEGRIAEKVRIAAKKVSDDWNNSIKYEDGTFDKPFLSPEGELRDQ